MSGIGKESTWFLTKSPNCSSKKMRLVEDAPIRGTRSLSEIYQRCNVAVFEPGDF